jgi:hypothetical protein
MVKNLFWANRKFNFITEIIDPNSKTQLFFLTVGVNFVVALSSLLLPALICGVLLIYVLQEKSLFFSLAALLPFLALSFRLWHFWEAPSLELQISTLIAPILGVIMLLSIIWGILKIKKRRTTGSTPSGNMPGAVLH